MERGNPNVIAGLLTVCFLSTLGSLVALEIWADDPPTTELVAIASGLVFALGGDVAGTWAAKKLKLQQEGAGKDAD